MAALEDAVRRVAELETVPSGVRVEALRAMLWLQTPARDADAGERARLVLANGAGGGDATRFEDFESYEAYVRREGESAEGASGSSSAGCVSDTWRGCDAQRHLLDALARRSATIAATGGGRRRRRRRTRGWPRARAAWTRATLDAVASVVAGGPRSADPAAVVDALHAAQRASLPGRSRERVLETAAALLRSARGARARPASPPRSPGTWARTSTLRAASTRGPRRRGARRPRGSAPGRTRSGSASASETKQARSACPPRRKVVRARRRPPHDRRRSPPRWPTWRAALTSRCWMTRAAAVSALATVALRSGEPFRLQCYTALREARSASTSSSHASSGGGQRGFDACASALERHVTTLDHVYRGGARFRALLARHGADETRWPAASLAEVAGRHDVLLELASSTCFLPVASYAPMGGDSRAFADAFAGDRARGGADGGGADGRGGGFGAAQGGGGRAARRHGQQRGGGVPAGKKHKRCRRRGGKAKGASGDASSRERGGGDARVWGRVRRVRGDDDAFRRERRETVVRVSGIGSESRRESRREPRGRKSFRERRLESLVEPGERRAVRPVRGRRAAGGIDSPRDRSWSEPGRSASRRGGDVRGGGGRRTRRQRADGPFPIRSADRDVSRCVAEVICAVKDFRMYHYGALRARGVSASSLAVVTRRRHSPVLLFVKALADFTPPMNPLSLASSPRVFSPFGVGFGLTSA